MGGLLWNPNSLLNGAALDQYEAIFSNGERILIVNDAGTLKDRPATTFYYDSVGLSSTANFEFATYQDRVYGDNGFDSPQTIDIVHTYGGVTYSFTLAKTKVMGAQAPASAPTVALIVDSTVNKYQLAHTLIKLLLSTIMGSEESNGGPASTPVTNDATTRLMPHSNSDWRIRCHSPKHLPRQ